MFLECPELSPTHHGNVTYNGTTPESSTAIYSCEKGYKLTGDQYRTCRIYSDWDGNVPRCISKLNFQPIMTSIFHIVWIAEDHWIQ